MKHPKHDGTITREIAREILENLTDKQRVELANCEYDQVTRVLKCQRRGCHKRVDWTTNDQFCYWCWRDEIHKTTARDEWTEFDGGETKRGAP